MLFILMFHLCSNISYNAYQITSQTAKPHQNVFENLLKFEINIGPQVMNPKFENQLPKNQKPVDIAKLLSDNKKRVTDNHKIL